MLDVFIPMALAAEAVIERNPMTYSWYTYFWVVFWGVAGGYVAFTRKLQLGAARPFNIMELLGDLFTSAFVGVITFWLCELTSVPPLATAACIAISGHMGSRVIFFLERVLATYMQAKIPVPKE